MQKKLDLQILKNYQVTAFLSWKQNILKNSRNFRKANKNCDNSANFSRWVSLCSVHICLRSEKWKGFTVLLLSYIENCPPSKTILFQRLFSIKTHVPLKVIFHLRLSSIGIYLSTKAVSHWILCSIEGLLPSKVLQILSSIKGNLPLRVLFHLNAWQLLTEKM